MSNITAVTNVLDGTIQSLFSPSEEETPPYLIYAGTALAMAFGLVFFCKCLPATVSSLFGRVSASSEQSLIDACKSLNKKKLDAYLKDKDPKIFVNRALYIGKIYTTPLILACQKYNPNDKEKFSDFMKHLIELGTDINAKDVNDLAPIHHALRNKNEEFALLLIKLGADINATDANGSTLLHHALCNKNEDLAASLIVLGADLNKPDGSGVYPLNYAARFGFEQLISSMIAKGANPAQFVEVKRNEGKEDEYIEKYRPLDEAVENGHVEIARKLFKILDNSKTDSETNIRKTGPMEVKVRHIPITRGNGNSFIHLPIVHGHKKMVEYLVDEEHLPILGINAYKETVFHYAAKYKQLEIMKTLLERLPSKKEDFLNSQDTGKQTAIVVAANLGYFDIVKMLGNAGAKTPNVINNEIDPDNVERPVLETALFIAAVCGKLEDVKSLLEISLRTNPNPVIKRNGFSLEQIAAQNGRGEVVAYLQEVFATANENAAATINKLNNQAAQKKPAAKTVVNPDKMEA